jgi:uncharacterized protein (TIGR02145 family)
LPSTNESGFTTIAAGKRSPVNGLYYDIGLNAYFWCADIEDDGVLWYLHLSNATIDVNILESKIIRMTWDGKRIRMKNNGYSVRCLKD